MIKRFRFLPLLLALAIASPVAFTPSRVFATDVTITPATVIPSSQAIIKSGVAGGAITRGQPVYFDSTAQGYKAADADALGGATVVGICLNDVGAGQPFQYVTRDPAFQFGGTLSGVSEIYVSKSVGGITATRADITGAGTVIVVLGVATSTTKMNLNIVQGGSL